ncbi:hypothetical protein BP6252_10874 [Coleophoma cylindrospora]|uniref:Cullin family profile domain-containing protein n=1 Tax=Coleophoma cylindrospora TaxID=1849047 RepID=A0A3D8QNH3_9HELO|nr:hypothetical protein BP6252_10874 [Coleophoma cylindrospora]
MSRSILPLPFAGDLDSTWRYLEVRIKTVLSEKGGSHLLGEDIYQKLLDFLNAHLLQVAIQAKTCSGQALVAFYAQEWVHYTAAAKYVDKTFSYLNRHYIRLRESIFNIMDMQRQGEVIDNNLVRIFWESLVSLENEDDPRRLHFYNVSFQIPLLKSTKDFFEDQSKLILAENGFTEYIKYAKRQLYEEEQRAKLYLHESAIQPLLKTCEEALVRDHTARLQSGFVDLLNKCHYSEVQIIYGLLSRVPSSLRPLHTVFETYVRTMALSSITNMINGLDEVDPRSYVNAMFQIYRECKTLVSRALDNDPAFHRALSRACKEVFNHNPACGGSGRKAAELLATYADLVLKKAGTGREADDRDNILTRITKILEFIEDKDVFQTFYSRKLGRRLRTRGTDYDQIENEMITKLRGPCGIGYTNSLQRMLRDIKVSKDLEIGFKEFMKEDGKIELQKIGGSYHVLSQNSWPLLPPSNHFSPPREIGEICSRFQSFYDQRYQGRKLTWLWKHCSGELQAKYASSKTPYRFQVSLYQMVILLLFNSSEMKTYQEIMDATELNSEALNTSLDIFLDAKVLCLGPEEENTRRNYRPDMVLRLNKLFKSKKIRINLNIVSKAEQKKDSAEGYKTIDIERSIITRATLVRIMKARKKLKYNELVVECITQLQSRFMLKDAMVKRAIDELMDNNYIDRADGDELVYVP